MSKNISNIAINGNKNVYNQSKIRASQVSYNNTFSGLTGTNVQQAIDELSTGSGGGTPAEPFSEGIVYGKTLGDTVSLGLNANNNNYPDNITIGHNAANGVLSYNNNTIIGNECLQNYTTSAVTNNTIIGNNNYTNTVSIPSVVDNIVIGNNITCISGPDELQNNILIGKGITSNCDDSIIINTDNNFTKNFNNMFYIGNGIKQPFSSNEFLISNGYNKYIIDGISSYGHDKIYLNYAITDDNSTDPQTPGVPPIPTDIFSTYKQINTIGTTSNEVTFTYVMAPSSDYILVSNYAYITPIQEPNITSIPSGNWVFNITGSVDISGDSFIIAKVFTFNSGFETLLFTTAPEPMLTSANPKIKIISPQPTITLIQSDRIVVKLYTYTTGAFSRVAQVLFDGQINQCYIDVPLTVNNNKTNFIVHYDQDTGTITKQPINNADESPTSKKVLKKDTYGRTLFRTFTGSNGITVTELPDELDFSFDTGLLPPGPTGATGIQGPTGPTGATGPMASNVNWQPTTLGSYYGKPFTAGDPQNMIAGYLSFPNLTTNDSTCLGNFNFPTYPNTITFSNNVLVGNTNQWQPSSGVERSIFISGQLSSNNLRNVDQSFWASTQSPNLGTVTDMNNSIIIHPGELGTNGGSGTNSFNNTISLITGKNNDIGSRNIILSNGDTNTLINCSTAVQSIILCNRDSNVTMPNFNNFCYIGDGTSLPIASNSFNSVHTTLRMPNLTVLTANTGNVRLMGYDTSTGLISPYLTSTFSRVYRQQANTNAAGNVTFNTGAVVSNSPGTTYHANVINASLTVAYTCQITSVTVNTVTIQVFQSTNAVLGNPTMIPAPANIVVSFSMNY